MKKTADLKQYHKEYYQNNKDKLISYQKEYYNKNKTAILAKVNSKDSKQYRKEYYQNHKTEILAKAKNKRISKKAPKIDLVLLKKQDSFTKLFEESKDKLFNIAYAVTQNQQAAEDVLQISFTKAWKNFDEYDPKKKFVNWMTSIVRNSAIDANRTKARHFNTYSVDNNQNGNDKIQTLDIIDKSADLFKIVENKELVEEIRVVINELPNDLKIVMLPFFAGESYEDIAKSVNLNLSTVRSRVHKAKGIIRNSPAMETFVNF